MVASFPVVLILEELKGGLHIFWLHLYSFYRFFLLTCGNITILPFITSTYVLVPEEVLKPLIFVPSSLPTGVNDPLAWFGGMKSPPGIFFSSIRVLVK